MPIACLFWNELQMSLESSKLADDFSELHVGDIYSLYLLKICHARGLSPLILSLGNCRASLFSVRILQFGQCSTIAPSAGMNIDQLGR